jgi:hypothetical protein
MKTLYESILSVNNVGLDNLIRNWLTEHQIFEDTNAYTIKNHIIYPKEHSHVFLFSGDECYNELPEYIQFADGPYKLHIGSVECSGDFRTIKSFRGLPENVRKLFIEFEEPIKIPELKIKTGEICIYGNGIFQPYNVLNIEYSNKYIEDSSRYDPQCIWITGITNDIRKLSSKSKFKGFTKVEFDEFVGDKYPADMFFDIIDFDKHTNGIRPQTRVSLSKKENEDLDELLKSLSWGDVEEIINIGHAEDDNFYELIKQSDTWECGVF